MRLRRLCVGAMMLGAIAVPAWAGPASGPQAAPPIADGGAGAVDEPSVAELKAALAELRRRLATQRIPDVAQSLELARQQIDQLTRTLRDLRGERDGLRRDLMAMRAERLRTLQLLQDRDQSLADADTELDRLRQELTIQQQQSARAQEELPQPVESEPPSPPAEPSPPIQLAGGAFAAGSAALRPEAAAALDAVAAAAAADPAAQIRIIGHTDASGDPHANLELSRRRAEAVRTSLVERFGLDPARLTAEGMGSAAPIATNETAEGRRENRRVEITLEAPVATTAPP